MLIPLDLHGPSPSLDNILQILLQSNVRKINQNIESPLLEQTDDQLSQTVLSPRHLTIVDQRMISFLVMLQLHVIVENYRLEHG